jgi:sensor c-di-GMP phosphodiesterase-like protein
VLSGDITIFDGESKNSYARYVNWKKRVSCITIVQSYKAVSLDLHVVAEGVETKEQLLMLQSLNCLE